MLSFNKEIFIQFLIKIIPGIEVTAEYVFFSILLGFGFGAVLLKARLCRFKILNKLAEIYISVMRCIPSIVLLFIIYYGIPSALENVIDYDLNELPPIVFVIITFTLFLAASSSEIMRSAYGAVNKGQLEAGVMSGLTEFQAFVKIILPQAFYAALPNIKNTIIFMLKEGALAYTIGLHDIFGLGNYLNGLKANAYPLETYVAMTCIYWPCSFIIEFLFTKLEHGFSIGYKIKKAEKRAAIKGGEVNGL